MTQVVVELKRQKDLVEARQAGREMADRLGFGLADQTRLVTAISELARNVLLYALEGTFILTDLSEPKMLRLKLEVVDHGPGIPDIEKAMSYGYTTGNGLGAGLPGAKSLLTTFHIESCPGLTRVTGSLERKRP